MEHYPQDYVFSFDSPDSPTLGMGNTDATQVENISNLLQESTPQSISPSSDVYDESKVFTGLDSTGMDFLFHSVQKAEITNEFPLPVLSVDEVYPDFGDLMNHAAPSPTRSSFNDPAEIMGIQTTTTCNDITWSYDHDMISPGTSSPKVLTVPSHPQYLDLSGPSSVESTSSANSNNQGAVKSARKPKQCRKPREPKKKLYEREEPFEDPVEEKKRKNAIKAYHNRQKKEGDFSRLENENSYLKSALVERDQLIAHLKKTIIDINNTNSSNSAKLEQIKKIIL